jgi:hypothetical protein
VLEVIKTLDKFHITHIPREANRKTNLLAQQASGYNVSRGIFVIKHEPGVQEMQDSSDQSAKMHGKAGCDIEQHTTETRGNSQQEEEAANGHVVKGTTREVRNKTGQGKDGSVKARDGDAQNPNMHECGAPQKNDWEQGVLGGDVREDWRKSIVECWSNPDKTKDIGRVSQGTGW